MRARLERRAEDSAATIAQRLDNAKREIERWRLYDYVVVNDDLQRAYRQVVAILTAERARGARVAEGIERFVDGAAGELRRWRAATARALAVVGALVCLGGAGVAIRFDCSASVRRRNAVVAVWRFVGFFTILTNLLAGSR